MATTDTEPRRASDPSAQDPSPQDPHDIGHIVKLRASNRTQTYLDTRAESAIEEFMKVTYSVEHYKELARRAQGLLEAALKGAQDSDKIEVQFRMTYRAKTVKSLREKLEARDKKRNYQTPRNILEDVKDLAGVRVVLYTPNKAQRFRVKQAIKEIWNDVEEVLHGGSVSSRKTTSTSGLNDDETDSENDEKEEANASEDGEEKYVPKHLGYQADHYRALMLPEQGDNSYGYKDLDRIEIQVVSALGHVWAEAGHDVMYKTHTYGNPTKLEHRILDALSGLITSGDLLLEEFRESVTKRTYARWKYLEEFTMWLRESDVMRHKEKKDGKITSVTFDSHFGAVGSDILYRFLTKVDKNYPIAVRDVLKSLDFPKDPDCGMEKELARFGPDFRPPHGLLAPFCVLSHLMVREPLTLDDRDVLGKCSVMMDAFILLQTFSGSPAAARKYLVEKITAELKDEERESLDFVLDDPHRRDCFLKVHDDSEDTDLPAGWDWFVKQANDDKLCGFFFRLAVMGIPAEEMGFSERLEKLKIKSLSRTNTIEEDNEDW